MTSNSEFYFHVLREGDILGIDEFFLIAVLSLIIGIFSIFLGLLVIKTKSDDQRNQILATILMLEGFGLIGWQWSWAFPHKEWMIPLVIFGSLVRYMSFIALSFCFLSLIGFQKHRIVKALKLPRVRNGLWIGGSIFAIVFTIVASDSLFHADWSGACGSLEHDAWMADKFGPDWESEGVKCDSTTGWDHFHYEYKPALSAIILIFYGSTSIFATVALFVSFRSLENNIEKRQARAFGLAFGMKTGFIALGVIFSVLLLANMENVNEDNRAYFHAIAFTFGMFVIGLLLESVMLAYGILREQIFGIESIFRKGMTSSILTFFAVIAITAVVELLQANLSQGYGLAGGIVLALLMTAGKSPLIFSINKITNILMPESTESKEEAFYRSQFELMKDEGVISERDRTILQSLSKQLELSDEQVDIIESGINTDNNCEDE